MNNEKLQRFALIAEIIGGTAVLVTLGVLVFEIRGNTEAVRTATYDALAADIADWRLNQVSDNELAETNFILSTEGRSALTPRQSLLNATNTIVLYQHYERAYIQWQAGNLDDSDWERFRSILCAPVGNPGFEVQVGQRLDRITTNRFTDYRKNQCTE